MDILFLAPQPFFQDRGTPIAVRLAVQVLAGRGTDHIDLLTYHEGSNLDIPNVRQIRINAPSCLKNLRPGISVKKLLCDLFFLMAAFRLVWRQRHNQYALVHAVEESVFIACLIKLIWGIPYIYDMDSSMAMQITEKWYLLKPLLPLLQFFEKIAVKYSAAVVPVCDALAAIADHHGAKDMQILRDISLLDMNDDNERKIDLRSEISVAESETILLYIGNLEHYQGIDLLIESFSEAANQHKDSHLVIIGGNDKHIALYKQKAAVLGLAQRIHLLGTRPVSSLKNYLLQADILVSPRTRGNNTPMKIYSYLHAGRAIIATNLPTHTQVMDGSVAMLAKPKTGPFAEALLELINNRELRSKLGQAANRLAEEKYTYQVFSRDLNALYDRIGSRLSRHSDDISLAA